jgi:GxxExxY protein
MLRIQPRITRISRIRRREGNGKYRSLHWRILVEEHLVHAELSRAIIGAAMTVLNELKPGLHEKLYENALAIELRHLGYEVSQQSRFDVFYRNQLIGTLVPDMIVDRLVIIDTKVCERFCDEHTSKMIGYLAKTRLDLAMLINFKHSTLQWKRVVRQAGLH